MFDFPSTTCMFVSQLGGARSQKGLQGKQSVDEKYPGGMDLSFRPFTWRRGA